MRVRDEAGLSTGLLVVPHPVEHVVVLTQTCDLQRTDARRYLCLLASAGEVDRSIAREVERGRRPGWAALPWLGDTWVVDLSLVTTVERTALAGAVSAGAPRTAQERRGFSESLVRHLTREAFPDHVNEALQPLATRLRQRHDRTSPEGDCLRRVAETRLDADPSMDDGAPALTVLFILDTEQLPSLTAEQQEEFDRAPAPTSGDGAQAAEQVLSAMGPVAVRRAWEVLAETWIAASNELAEQDDRIGSLAVEVMNADELSYARSRRSPLLDLRHLSTRTS